MSNDLKSKKLIAALFILMMAVYSTNAACVFSSPIQVKDLNIGNLITWNTSEEQDNEFFVIQKSLDGIHFNTIGQVKAAGNSKVELAYRFLDAAIGERKVFYRLAQLTSKGDQAFTETIIAQRDKNNNYVISAMSATSTDRFFTATISSNIEAYLEYRLLDQEEKVVKSGATYMKIGGNTFSIDLKNQKQAKYKLEFLMQKEKETIYLRKIKKTQLEKLNYVIKTKKD